MARVEEEVDTVEVSGMAAAWCTAFARLARCQRHEHTAMLMCTADLSDATMKWPADQPAEPFSRWVHWSGKRLQMLR